MPHHSPRNNIWLKINPWFVSDVVPALRGRIAELLSIYSVRWILEGRFHHTHAVLVPSGLANVRVAWQLRAAGATRAADRYFFIGSSFFIMASSFFMPSCFIMSAHMVSFFIMASSFFMPSFFAIAM